MRSNAKLQARGEQLEADVAELRRHNRRLSELTDLVQELLIPMAQRDQDRVDAAEREEGRQRQ